MFVCQRCGARFELAAGVRGRYPGWTPQLCAECHGGTARETPVEQKLTTAQVLERYTEGPRTGVFTDGSAVPNPGPGGWGAVYVVDDAVVAARHG
jgi:ribonuclease HI